MSSHHIVREYQEPALIIANGEACNLELMGQLLEWSPLVIVLDSAVYRVMDLGIKIDVLLGDFDRDIDIELIKAKQHPIEVVHTPDQVKTDLEKALDYLIAKGHTAANIVWATGRRADHCITNMTNLVRYRNLIKVVMFDDHSRIYPLPNHFEKWYSAQTPISLIPIGTVEGIYSENLKYPLHNDILTLGYRTGSSNEALQNGIVKISYQKGDLLMMECFENE
jgi:thiamine pyrophosphokinase